MAIIQNKHLNFATRLVKRHRTQNFLKTMGLIQTTWSSLQWKIQEIQSLSLTSQLSQKAGKAKLQQTPQLKSVDTYTSRSKKCEKQEVWRMRVASRSLACRWKTRLECCSRRNRIQKSRMKFIVEVGRFSYSNSRLLQVLRNRFWRVRLLQTIMNSKRLNGWKWF